MARDPDLPPPPAPRRKDRRAVPAPPPPVGRPEPEPEPVTLVPPPPAVDPDLASRASALLVEELREKLAEKANRVVEALRVFVPLPEQERFFASEADERLGIGGNRSGKTTTVMIEIGRAVTGTDPYGKYPKEDGIFILVAKDLGQCARVFYRKLFMAGAFHMIRDRLTRRWRPFRPDDPDDADREDEAKPAPPLIPPRLIKSISWENKKERQPRTVILKNGWELWFFSSGGEWPQGVDVDGVAFDEEIERSGWYAEMAARLADRRKKDRKTGKVRSGKFMWSATPQAGTIQLYELFSRAQEELAAHAEALERGEDPPPPSIQVFEFGLRENPYIAQHAKDALIRKYRDNEEEYAVRIEGRFALLGMRVYPEFAPRGAHAVALEAVPADWTRYCAIDPGRQVCAVLFAAVPPPSHPLAEHVVIYDELYIRRCDAPTFARRFRLKLADQVIQAAVIDMRAGRIQEMGSGLAVAEQYRRALQAEGVRFAGAGDRISFLWSTASGADDIKAGILAVHSALHVGAEGSSRFLFVVDRLPHLVAEIEKYVNMKHASGVILDKPLQLNCHLCDDLRYLAMARLKWVRPRPRKHAPGYAATILAGKRKRARAKAGGDAIGLY